MRVIIRPRQGGKTTEMLEWMKAAAGDDSQHRICVSHSEHEAMRLYLSTWDEDGNPTWAESWQFVGPREPFAERPWEGVLRGRGGHIVLGLDNLDLLVGRYAGWPVDIFTMTREIGGADRVPWTSTDPLWEQARDAIVDRLDQRGDVEMSNNRDSASAVVDALREAGWTLSPPA